MCLDGNEDHLEEMEGRPVDSPDVPTDLIYDAEMALDLAKDLCKGSKISMESIKMFLDVVQQSVD
ncbi:hypothetical protein OCU04_009789 [Sclerotinia nivalis]|uniref:Uncharacterized protein n=1 Tax=Sclerotinia nivalis TaxID=352851 RepID=A0A9X0AFS6_9HELO|nr:hypothetical protein OCU04_009789 [Sclerotinia nivalis]